MRPVDVPQWRRRAAAGIDEGAHSIEVIDLPRDENLEFVRQSDETTVEHPMSRSREGDPVVEAVRAVPFDGPDMSCIHLGPSTTVDELQTRDGASLVIGTQDDLAENAVPHDARRELLHPVA